MRIDVQSHTFPLEYARFLAKHSRYPAVTINGSDLVIDYKKNFVAKGAWDRWSPEKTIKEMDENNIDLTLLSLSPPCASLLPGDLAIPGARIANEGLMEISAQYPGRFKLVGTLPWNLPGAAIEEARRIKKEGFVGVTLFSQIGPEDPVDLPVYHQIYEELANIGLVIFLHPMPMPWGDYLREYHLVPMVGFMVTEGLALLRLIMSGVVEKNPKLRIVHPHCGGILPALAGRIWNMTAHMGRGMDLITVQPTDMLKTEQIWYDTVSPDPISMKFLADFLGSTERIMFGSDAPWISMSLLLDQLHEAFPDEKDRENIMSGAAKNLLGI